MLALNLFGIFFCAQVHGPQRFALAFQPIHFRFYFIRMLHAIRIR